MNNRPPVPLQADFRFGAVAAKQFPTDGLPQVAFAGRSNVGKSSIQNALLGRKKLVRASNTPGRTREINFFILEEKAWFVDLPGFGYARGGIKSANTFADLVGQYLSQDGQPRMVVYLIDASVTDSEVDRDCLRKILDAGVPCRVVLSKVDRLNQSQRLKAPRSVQEIYGLAEPPLMVSSHKGTGLDRLGTLLLADMGLEAGA